eukprot:1228394-Rhodomonas_salina.1
MSRNATANSNTTNRIPGTTSVSCIGFRGVCEKGKRYLRLGEYQQLARHRSSSAETNAHTHTPTLSQSRTSLSQTRQPDPSQSTLQAKTISPEKHANHQGYLRPHENPCEVPQTTQPGTPANPISWSTLSGAAITAAAAPFPSPAPRASLPRSKRSAFSSLLAPIARGASPAARQGERESREESAKTARIARK